MKKRYSEEQIIKAIKRHESGVKIVLPAVIFGHHFSCIPSAPTSHMSKIPN